MYVGGGVNEQIGDIETVTGVLTDYSGEIEIDPAGASDVTKTGTGTVPAPVVVTTQQIAQLKYTDLIDGELVTIPVSTITTYNPPSLGLTDLATWNHGILRQLCAAKHQPEQLLER